MSEHVDMDTLQKFGASFQNKTIAALLGDEKFLLKVFDIVRPEFFESENNKFIMEEILKYYNSYKVPPTVEALSIIIKKQVQSDKRIHTILEQLKLIYAAFKATDLDFVKEEFLMFCKNQKMKQSILESVDLLKLGKYREIQEIMAKALDAGEEPVLGHNYKLDFEARFAEDARKTIPTGFAAINSLMGGGLGPGELGVFIGGAGAGKSWLLAHLGLHAMKTKYHVSHYTLELNELYTAHRYDTCLTGINLQDLMIPENKDQVERSMQTVVGDLIVTQYPTKFASPFTIHNHQKRLRQMGFKADLIIVDYADLLSSGNKQESMYEAGGSIYEQLRGIAGELQVPLWTVSQAQRASLNDEIIEADRIAESFKKIMTADFVASLSRRTEDKINNTARMHIIKNRFGMDGLTFNLQFIPETGVIEIIGNDSHDEAIRTTKEMLNNKKNGKDEDYALDAMKKRVQGLLK